MFCGGTIQHNKVISQQNKECSQVNKEQLWDCKNLLEAVSKSFVSLFLIENV